MLLFRIKSPLGVAHKNVFFTKKHDVVLKSFKYEEITFFREFIFVFIPYFIAAISSKNVKSGGFRKRIKRRVWPYRGVVYRRGRVKPSAYDVYSELTVKTKVN